MYSTYTDSDIIPLTQAFILKRPYSESVTQVEKLRQHVHRLSYTYSEVGYTPI